MISNEFILCTCMIVCDVYYLLSIVLICATLLVAQLIYNPISYCKSVINGIEH